VLIKRLLLCLTLLFSPALLAEDSASGEAPRLLIKTSEGDITVVLYPEKSPQTVANFLAYVDEGFYAGTIFHRVIPQFMVQGGGFLPDMSQKDTRDPVVNESKNKLHNVRGTLAMARTNDPDSATAQFFINQRSNLRLDWSPGKPGYTVFGEVVDGMKVVDFMASAPTGKVGTFTDVPLEPILIKEIIRLPAQ
jgi:cyclophilin family peptidyl-prolyl cis-trans isomerase